MGSYLIDYILFLHQFPKLNCTWNYTKTPIYDAYKILWAHKYSSFYKLIYEELQILMYELIFLKEWNYMSKGAMEIICEYGYYYLYKEGTYLRI